MSAVARRDPIAQRSASPSSDLPPQPEFEADISAGRSPLSPASPSPTWVVEEFERVIAEEPTIAVAVAAMQALTEVVKRSSASTMMGLEKELKEASLELRRKNPSSISLAAGCDLFTRHVTRTSLDNPSFAQCVSLLVDRGQSYFTSLSVSARSKIAASFSQFIHPGHRILVHGFSRVVLASLRHASQLGLSFSVLTTEARPYCDGYRVVEELTALGIHVTLILDGALAYAMERVDIVMVGAEGVAESGGIINKAGTYTCAIIAAQFSKPLYVCAECYKFTRLFPLSQRDLPERREQQQPLARVHGNGGSGGASARDVCSWPEVKDAALFAIDNPQCDYTPPQYVSLLFTDLGILTASAVSDELIKLYY